MSASDQSKLPADAGMEAYEAPKIHSIKLTPEAAEALT